MELLNKVEVHGLEFTHESHQGVPGELAAAKENCARILEAVQEADQKLDLLKDAPLQKMMAVEVHDKLCIANQVYDRRWVSLCCWQIFFLE